MMFYPNQYQKNFSTPQSSCHSNSVQPSSTNCRYAFNNILSKFLCTPLLQYIDPVTFTLYTPYISTSEDTTIITNTCNCLDDLLRFESALPYDAIPLCDLSAFSVLVKNPLMTLPELKQLLTRLCYQSTNSCYNSYYNSNSYDCLSGIKSYLTSQAAPFNIRVNDADFTDLTFIGLCGPLAFFIQTGMTPQSPPVPFVRILVVCIDSIAALGI